MKTKYFSDCKTIEEAKRLYHKLAVKHHPDLGGDLETMQAINAEYDTIAERLKNIHESADGKQYTAQTENTEIPSDFRDIINSIIHFKGVNIELVGRWIWLTGNTYSYKEHIKKLGFSYASAKKAWYWHALEDSTVNRKHMTLEQIKEKYGCTAFQTSQRLCIA